MKRVRFLSYLLAFFIVIVIAGCASKGEPPTQIEPPTLQPDLGRQAPSGESVLQYSKTEPLPLGDQTHVTITDSAGNTLYERVPSFDKTYKVTLPKDGNLYITTHWSGGPPTRQEIVHPVEQGAPSQVVIRWDQNAKSYTTATRVELASEPRPVEPISIEAKKLEVVKGGTGGQYGSSLSAGVIMGLTRAKVGSRFSSVFGNGSAALDDNGPAYGLELNYDFNPGRALERLRVRPYVIGGWRDLHQLKFSAEYVNDHPGAANDSGTGIKFSNAFFLGGGLRYSLAPKVDFAFVLGLHGTRVKGMVFSDESSGGGPNNEFSTTKSFLKPWAGVEVSWKFPLFGRRNDFFARYEYFKLDDFQVSGRSPYTGATYTGSIDAKHLNNFSIGWRLRFGGGIDY